MNREIKFRGLPFEKGWSWQYGYLIKQMYRGKEKFYVGYVQNGAIMGIEVNPETVRQYTGLKDSTGKEIYEGDIVLIGEKLKAKVIYYDGAFRMQSEFSPTPIDTTDMGYMMREFSVRVIGNIHDNPELMKLSV